MADNESDDEQTGPPPRARRQPFKPAKGRRIFYGGGVGTSRKALDVGTESVDLDEFARMLREQGELETRQAGSEAVLGLDSEVIDLRRRLGETERSLAEARDQKDQDASRIQTLEQELKTQNAELDRKEEIRDLLSSVDPLVHKKLLHDKAFVAQFSGPKPTFVMSVDIRRSTELMLKASDPGKFAEFITELCGTLQRIVWLYDGIFDKFTGDGILAFFPEFFSGPDAGYRALMAAKTCHNLFRDIYGNHKDSFDTVLLDVGLGIGIDYGEPHLVRQWGSLTVVGKPVVYACRLNGASPGETLVNQKAFTVLKERHGDHLDFERTSIDVKHEGRTLAYKVRVRDDSYNPRQPAWMEEMMSRSSPEASADDGG